MMTRRDLLFSAIAAPTAAAATSRSAKVEIVFRSPGPKPNGLQATREGLWILDQGDNRAYLVTYEGGRVLRALDTGSKAGSGITFDGEALWLASTYSREIIRADAHSGKTLAKYPTPGSGVVHWPNPRQSPLAPKPGAGVKPASTSTAPRQATGAHGLEWKNARLWMAVPPAQTIYRVNPAGFTVEHQFRTAGDRPHGLGWEGDWLWCADSNDNAFYKYDTRSGEVVGKIQLGDRDPLPHGMTIWNGWMWYCDDVGIVCRLRM
jgi:hypothetical protein